MAYAAQLRELDWRYDIILILCLSLLVGPHINWKIQVMVRRRKAGSFVSRQTIQIAKDQKSPKLTQTGIYISNDTEIQADTCCIGAN